MIVAGIDPGKSGALAILWPDSSVLFLDVPLAGKKPAWTSWAASWGFALSEAAPERIIIEDVHSMPKQGVTSSFNFGEVLGFVHAIALASCPGAVIEWPTPAVWKRKLGLTADKGMSIEEAKRCYPSARDRLTRVKDDGRAEALLLAHYGRKYL